MGDGFERNRDLSTVRWWFSRAVRQCVNPAMKAENATKPHPGPWRLMRVDSGLVGILIAIACHLLLH
jgi:hypothetical protein